jgi:hypothetical protein
LGSSKLVILGGLAELFSGAISMGLGGFLASLTERDSYDAERAREEQEVIKKPVDETLEIYEAMEKWGIRNEVTDYVVDHFKANHVHWVDVRVPYHTAFRLANSMQFMMDVEFKKEKPEKKRAYVSLASLAGSYLIGMFAGLELMS